MFLTHVPKRPTGLPGGPCFTRLGVRLAQIQVTELPPHIYKSFYDSELFVGVFVVANTTATTSTLQSRNDAEERRTFDLQQPFWCTSGYALKGRSPLLTLENNAFGNVADPQLIKAQQ